MATFLTIIGLILGAIPLYELLKNRYRKRPELTIEFKKESTHSTPIGISDKNVPDENNVILVTEVIRVFQLKWDFKILIRNNSDVAAFYPKISFKDGSPYFVKNEKLNEFEAIASTETKELSLRYQEVEEAKGSNRNDMSIIPKNIEDLEILLEYKNTHKVFFYTLYNHQNNTNKFLNKKPKGF